MTRAENAERALLTTLYHTALSSLPLCPPRVAGAARGLIAELARELGMVNPLPSRDDRRGGRVVQ